MTAIGYTLVSERVADRQGNSPFVWGVLGAIAEATERIELATGVTCPTFRIHPAIVAQAAATAAARPATTTSTSTRSARRRRASSTSTRARFCRG
jgi:hypothetical protein